MEKKLYKYTHPIVDIYQLSDEEEDLPLLKETRTVPLPNDICPEPREGGLCEILLKSKICSYYYIEKIKLDKNAVLPNTLLLISIARLDL